MATPPFVSPVRLGLAAPGQPGALVSGSLALLLDPLSFALAYDPDVVSAGDGASITGAVRLTAANNIGGRRITTDDTETALIVFDGLPTDRAALATLYIVGEDGAHVTSTFANLTLTTFSGSFSGPAMPLVPQTHTFSGGTPEVTAMSWSDGVLTISVTGKAATTIRWSYSARFTIT